MTTKTMKYDAAMWFKGVFHEILWRYKISSRCALPASAESARTAQIWQNRRRTFICSLVFLQVLWTGAKFMVHGQRPYALTVWNWEKRFDLSLPLSNTFIKLTFIFYFFLGYFHRVLCWQGYKILRDIYSSTSLYIHT